MATRKSPTAGRSASKAAAPPAAASPSAATAANGPAKAPRRRTATNDAIEFHEPKQQLVRDSFTFTKTEYAVLRELKHRAAQLARPSKKSEILRAGVRVLDAMSDTAFVAALAAVPSLKSRRLKSKSRNDGKPAAGRTAADQVLKPIFPKSA